MKQITTIAMALLIVFWNIPAHSDWIDPGISYKCNTSEKVFALEAVMGTSSPEDAGTIPIRDGFTMLSKPKHTLSCKIGKNVVIAKLSKYPGSEKGMCAAFGFIDLDSLKINGKEILEHSEMFNSGCFFDPVLFRVEIKDISGKPVINLCKGKWDWGVGYHEIECSEKNR